MTDSKPQSMTEACLEEISTYSANNYAPLDIVISRAEGIYMYDVEGNKYFDMLSAYSAVNQGHQHPKIVKALINQVNTLALTSRAYHNDKMGPFLKKLCGISKMTKALPMNSGAEAVETAIKAMRKWGYESKGIATDKAEIIVCEDNFHGRTSTIVSFSTDPDARDGYGPASPGFKIIPYNDPAALEAAINENTCGFLVEPIQGEAGVKLPSEGYLKAVREICSKHNVLLCFDEIQTGLARTGKMFCHLHEGVTPDIMTVGKALSGGLYPISAMLSNDDVMKVFTPGSHGSTFGGNPLAAAIGSAALDVIVDENLCEKATTLGALFKKEIAELADLAHIKEIRGKGLLIAIEMNSKSAKARCKALAKKGILAKDTHETTVRFAPPLIITEEQIKEAAAIVLEVFKNSE